jgi:pyridoxal phosphate enzyme (YggS family)
VDAGIRALGENRVQEAEAKASAIAGAISWHLIGRLQSNKTRRAAALFDAVHSIDRPSLVTRLDEAALAQGRTVAVYVQVEYVRTADSAEEVERRASEVCAQAAGARSLRLEGLMTLPPFASDPEDARVWFRRLRYLRDRLEVELGTPLPGLSMGMSQDFEVAVEEGSTIVRVGSAIFGARRPQ